MRSLPGLTVKPVARFGLALSRRSQVGPATFPTVGGGEVARASTETAQEASEDRSIQEPGRDPARERALRTSANLEAATRTVTQARAARVSLEPTPRVTPPRRNVARVIGARAERTASSTTIVPSEDPVIYSVQAARAARRG